MQVLQAFCDTQARLAEAAEASKAADETSSGMQQNAVAPVPVAEPGDDESREATAAPVAPILVSLLRSRVGQASAGFSQRTSVPK